MPRARCYRQLMFTLLEQRYFSYCRVLHARPGPKSGDRKTSMLQGYRMAGVRISSGPPTGERPTHSANNALLHTGGKTAGGAKQRRMPTAIAQHCVFGRYHSYADPRQSSLQGAMVHNWDSRFSAPWQATYRLPAPSLVQFTTFWPWRSVQGS